MKYDTWLQGHSEKLHDTAIAWGFDEMSERPLIKDSNGYVRQPVRPIEMLKGKRGHIGIFQLNGRWGYCLQTSLRDQGWGYAAFLGFCEPHPTRSAALRAAVATIKNECERAMERDATPTGQAMARELAAWAEGLIAPQQLSLF